MSDLTPLMPREPIPELDVTLAGGGRWSLSESKPENFDLIVVYRGLHCPICKTYLGKLDKMVEDLEERGVDTIAISSDDAERGETAKADWGLDTLRIGYGLTLKSARQWGLYVSSGIGKTSVGVEEPARFAEPGLFMVRPDKTLFFATVQTMPFLRPDLTSLLANIDFVLGRDYPARGEVASLAE